MENIILSHQFYYNLQNSRLKEHAFEEWKEYRNQVTNLLIKTCSKGKTLAIFGAGRCSDIDLARLTGHFAQITLMDINESALLFAIKQYNLEKDPNVNILIQDFVGIEDKDYIRYTSTLLDEYENISASLHVYQRPSNTLKQLDRMYKKAKYHSLDFGKKQYDYSLVLNIHSQLNDTADWIWTEIQRLLDRDGLHLDSISNKIRCETGGIIRKFNDAVFSATKEKVLIGYETGMEGRNINGIHGAMQTYQDLRERERKDELSLIQKNILTWPYDRAKKIVFSVAMETFMIL